MDILKSTVQHTYADISYENHNKNNTMAVNKLHSTIIFLAVLSLMLMLVSMSHWSSKDCSQNAYELNVPSNSNMRSMTESKMNTVNCVDRFNGQMQRSKRYRKERVKFIQGLKDLGDKFRGRSVFDAWEPEFDCPTELRIGGLFGDGGKWLCFPDVLAARNHSIVYSVGSRFDLTFEEDIRHYVPNSEIHTFDHTLDHSKKEYKPFLEQLSQWRIHFHEWGLGSGSEEDKKKDKRLHTISQMAADLGHRGKTIDVLKVDCEFCEYESFKVLYSALAAMEIKVNVILVEVHSFEPKLTDLVRAEEFFAPLDDLGFLLYHKERNNWARTGFLCAEFAFIHKSFAYEGYVSAYCPDIVNVQAEVDSYMSTQ